MSYGNLTVKIQGLEQANAKLTDLDNKLQQQVIRAGLKDGGKIVKTACEAVAPVRSGLTRSEIKIRGGGVRSDGTMQITVGVSAKDYTGKAFYASFVLYGYHVGSRKLGDKRKEVPGRPWLLEGFDNVKDEVVTKVSEKWVEKIEKIVGSQ